MKTAIILISLIIGVFYYGYLQSEYYNMILKYNALQRQVNWLSVESKLVYATQLGGNIYVRFANQDEATRFLKILKRSYPDLKIMGVVK